MRYPYDLNLDAPVPAAGATEAQKLAFYDELTLDAAGCIIASPSTPAYIGACIREITAISPTPAPGTVALLALGLAGLGALARRRQHNRAGS